jgi:FHA domain
MTQPAAGLVCPNGHTSEESDYCSVCGAPMPGSSAPAAAPPAAAPVVETCPSCGTPRSDRDARFCEVCRYDYQAHAPGPPPVVVTSGPPPDPAAAAAGHADWEVTIVLDPSLDTESDPDVAPPPDVGDRIFPIDLAEMLVGRRDDAHHIRPELPVFDPGVSRRHAQFLRLPDGKLAIVDLASANGTAVNGVGLVAGERRELADGDVVTMGRWTRITVCRRSQVGS